MQFEGTPTDQAPDVLATGRGDVRLAFLSLSAREPNGRDADYLAWHALDHRPEQYRLIGLRNSLRLVSTPACRAARAASGERFDAVDHVMTYLFADPAAIPPFMELGRVLHEVGRMPLLLPRVATLIADFAGKAAAPRAVAGADVIPWRPAVGAYLIIEEGHAPAEGLVKVPGVAGVWWWHGGPGVTSNIDASGLQFTYCYLDEDPVEVAGRLAEHMRWRWETSGVKAFLAAPFYTAVPYDWTRHLPGERRKQAAG